MRTMQRIYQQMSQASRAPEAELKAQARRDERVGRLKTSPVWAC
jgi:hypothetical protein